MMIYLELPFTNTVCLDDGLCSANLTEDYAEHFTEMRRYKYQRHSLTKFKCSGFNWSTGNYRWVYTVTDPRTFVLH
jgi:hypothetical protein